jgi:hypothetical protein
MAVQLLKARGDTEDLGKNWQARFLRRHPSLKSTFSTPQDKNRVLAGEEDVITHFFDLYAKKKEMFNIQDEDIYNIDEKGAIMGVIGKLKVIVSKHEKKPKMTQDRSREWATMIKCVSLLGQVLSKWIIFKGKVQ